ncbi:hypothetical protein DEA8626_01190 [Defluviimonas aquaemixtae]|uniref:DUF5666 domain-containing protein n=1 Tax=Albidovulum aquaemixtae TaxID=1542388 RepID=A0A2R8B4V8_9RHOB|nr:DUF6152 family protein [Defluviimonas aquaemixtae]SPH17666.1 hypothetical protein DEA8626_01190 [Defluviimonas aquaemixtae]
MQITRRGILALVAALAATPVAAHHGWRWTNTGEFELTGLITKAKLGNPHGVLTIDADGEIWTAEIGQPWRNERAGLSDDMFEPGTEITLLGHRSADQDELVMKAERVIIAGKRYDLYPDRS